MPKRATKRGSERTPLSGTWDVLICGGSFAGLSVARELAGSGASVLIIDRYEIGEKQTSACGIPTTFLHAMDLMDAHQQTFDSLVVHTPHGTRRWPLPWTFSTFDYRTLCSLLFAQTDARFETAKVNGRTGNVVHTDRGDLEGRVVIDALGWRRVLAPGENVQPPDAYLSRGLEVHPHGSGDELELWIDRKYIPAGYGWSFPADGEVRVGIGSFRPRDHVKDPTNQLADDLSRDRVNYQGNWIPHRLRDAVEDGVAFVGDSAGHCLPVTAEGIRPAIGFGLVLGRELRAWHEGRRSLASALSRYERAHDKVRWKFECSLRVQDLVPRLPTRVLFAAVRAHAKPPVARWSFNHYLAICPPELATPPRYRRPAEDSSAELAA